MFRTLIIRRNHVFHICDAQHTLTLTEKQTNEKNDTVKWNEGLLWCVRVVTTLVQLPPTYAIGMGTKEITLKPTAGKTLSLLLLVFIVLGFSTAGFDLLARRLLCSHLVLSLDWYTIHVLHIWYL